MIEAVSVLLTPWPVMGSAIVLFLLLITRKVRI
jgi:hypothetical protein